jgi:hypothetical protein
VRRGQRAQVARDGEERERADAGEQRLVRTPRPLALEAQEQPDEQGHRRAGQG